MDQRPVGVFDSGVGGLSAVRELRKLLPSENIIYFGDTSRVPYGGRSPEILLKYARQDVHFLRSFDIKAILVACGTVSTTCLPVLRGENDLPILGVVEPACRRAVQMTKNGRVGLIATAASVRSGAYEKCIAEIDPAVEVIAKACPLFVPLVENGRYRPGDAVIETVAREYLEPLGRTGIDTLILGCTHYPLLMDVIGGIMGPAVTLINARRPPGISNAPSGTVACSPPGRAGRPPSTPATSPRISARWPSSFCRRSCESPSCRWILTDTKEGAMEGNTQIRIASRSVFGGVEDVIRMEGSATVEKTEYGWHLQYEAVNCEDEKSAIRSDVKLENETGRAIVVNEGEGYGLLLDPAAVTASQIRTPQGNLTLNVKTKEVTWDLSGRRDGSVVLEYMLLVGMQPVSALRVSLFLKKI